MLRSFYPLWNASAQTEGGVRPIFADSGQKSVTIAMSLERSRKESRINHVHLYPPIPKFGEDGSEITGLQGTAKKKIKEIYIGRT